MAAAQRESAVKKILEAPVTEQGRLAFLCCSVVGLKDRATVLVVCCVFEHRIFSSSQTQRSVVQ